MIWPANNNGSNIDKYEVLYSHNNSTDAIIPTLTVTGIDAAAYLDTLPVIGIASGTDRYTVRITNKDGKTAQKSVTFNHRQR